MATASSLETPVKSPQNYTKYSKLGILISKCLPMLLRKHVEKHVKSCKPDIYGSEPWTLDDFLYDNREAITNPNTSGHRCVLTPAQKTILFPGRRKTTDIDQWDLSLLCFIILGYCEPSRHLTHDIENMKSIRNKLFHIGDPNISDDKYERNVEQIKILIQRGLTELDDSNLEKEINETIADVENGKHFKEDPLVGVNEWFNNEALQNSFQGMYPEAIQKITETLEIIERKLSLSEQGRPHFYCMCTVILLIQNSTGDKERHISQLLKEKLDDKSEQQVSPTLTKEHQEQFYRATETFLKHLCRSGEREIEKVDKGCLVITIKCTSIKSLYSLWQECARGDVTSYLHPIQRCIRELDGCERVEIKALIEESEVSRCLQQLVFDISQQDVMVSAAVLENSNENTDDRLSGSKLKLDIQTKSFEQVRHIADVCKSGELNRHLEMVSKTVEDILNIKDVSIKALFEEEQMSNDLKEDSSCPDLPYLSHAKTEMSQDHEQQQGDASAAKEDDTVKTSIRKTEMEPAEQKVYLVSDTVSKTEEIVEIAIPQTEMEPVGQKVYLDRGATNEDWETCKDSDQDEHEGNPNSDTGSSYDSAGEDIDQLQVHGSHTDSGTGSSIKSVVVEDMAQIEVHEYQSDSGIGSSGSPVESCDDMDQSKVIGRRLDTATGSSYDSAGEDMDQLQEHGSHTDSGTGSSGSPVESCDDMDQSKEIGRWLDKAKGSLMNLPVHISDIGVHGYQSDSGIDSSFLSVQTLDKVPNVKELATIANTIGNNWKQLTLELGLSQADFEQAQSDHPHSAVDQGITILKKWAKKSEKTATFRELKSALRQTDICTTDVFKGIKSGEDEGWT